MQGVYKGVYKHSRHKSKLMMTAADLWGRGAHRSCLPTISKDRNPACGCSYRFNSLCTLCFPLGAEHHGGTVLDEPSEAHGVPQTGHQGLQLAAALSQQPLVDRRKSCVAFFADHFHHTDW